jgi:phosphohistidine phosphatase
VARVPAWMYRQSAVIPYRRGPSGLEVLLVTSRKGTRWVLPKGVVEPDLSPAASAAKEALEEAGVRGPIDDEPLGARISTGSGATPAPSRSSPWRSKKR